MKLLHWHKLANEAALKAALIRTKKMKRTDSVNPPKETLQEKAEWMQQIIEEEQAKPLQVGKDYILKYEEEEKRNEAALQKQVEVRREGRGRRKEEGSCPSLEWGMGGTTTLQELYKDKYILTPTDRLFTSTFSTT